MPVSIICRRGKEFLQSVIDASNTYVEVLNKYGLSPIGNNYNTLNKYIRAFDIDTSGIEKRRLQQIGTPPAK